MFRKRNYFTPTRVPSSKRGVFEDELPKSAGLSSKRGLNEDELPKNTGLSSKRAVFEDGL
jgi:hypothetical protein